jgi:hypothetical protein
MEREAMFGVRTEYYGTWYRTRTDARWGVFFSSLGIKFVYEPECFLLENFGEYTPTFWLVDLECFVVIQEHSFYNAKRPPADELCGKTKRPVHLFCGNPCEPDVKTKNDDLPECSYFWQENRDEVLGYNFGTYWLCCCPNCGTVSFGPRGKSDSKKCCGNENTDGKNTTKNAFDPKILEALYYSKNAFRFNGKGCWQ